MKTKLLLNSVLSIAISTPGLAEITSGATCDTTNLGQSENNSTANVEADWTANTINIDWWTGDEDSDEAYASTTCTYDGTITLPTEPTKTGYTFNGWVLVEEEGTPSSAPVSSPGCPLDAQYTTQEACQAEEGCVWNSSGGLCCSPYSAACMLLQ